MIITDMAQIDRLADEILDRQTEGMISIEKGDYLKIKKNSSFLRAVRVVAEIADPDLAVELSSGLMQLMGSDMTGLLLYVGCGKEAGITMAQLKAIHDAIPFDLTGIDYVSGIGNNEAVPDGHVMILAVLGCRQ